MVAMTPTTQSLLDTNSTTLVEKAGEDSKTLQQRMEVTAGGEVDETVETSLRVPYFNIFNAVWGLHEILLGHHLLFMTSLNRSGYIFLDQ